MSDRILIIDDSIPLHNLIRSHMKKVSLDVHSAYDGKSGLSMAASLRPSLILLDLDMSDIDGLAVCKILKADAQTAAIPVIFLTADPQISDKIAALNLGTIGHIIKPFQPEELAARVSAVLQAKHALHEELMIDGLTGLANIHNLEASLVGEMEQAIRLNHPVGCIVCDIDGLRRINSKCGVPFGDDVIRCVGKVLSSCGRANDVVGHLGAGRFAVVVPKLGRRDARRLAQRHCHVIQETLLTLSGVEVGVRCSFGVADTQVTGESLLIERSTAALHRAKLNGGGCVCVARPHRSAQKTAA